MLQSHCSSGCAGFGRSNAHALGISFLSSIAFRCHGLTAVSESLRRPILKKPREGTGNSGELRRRRQSRPPEDAGDDGLPGDSEGSSPAQTGPPQASLRPSHGRLLPALRRSGVFVDASRIPQAPIDSRPRPSGKCWSGGASLSVRQSTISRRCCDWCTLPRLPQ